MVDRLGPNIRPLEQSPALGGRDMVYKVPFSPLAAAVAYQLSLLCLVRPREPRPCKGGWVGLGGGRPVEVNIDPVAVPSSPNAGLLELVGMWHTAPGKEMIP